MDWTEKDIITMNRYREAFPDIYHKADVFHSEKPIIWWGKHVQRPPPKTPFIISGHSDYEITDTQSSMYPNTIWFAVNAGSSSVHGLPYGIIPRDPDLPHTVFLGDTACMLTIAHTPKQDRNLVYMNFTIDTYIHERQRVWDMFRGKSWVTCGTYELSRAGREAFLTDLRNHTFVLCPRGNGVDTVRLWETLYMGSIPIVKQHIVHKDWQDLPILFVSSWEEVTEEFLWTKRVEFASRSWCMEKLKVGYWIDKIRSSLYK